MSLESILASLTPEEKADALDILWRDLSANPARISSPDWHGEVLANRIANPSSVPRLPIDAAFDEVRERDEAREDLVDGAIFYGEQSADLMTAVAKSLITFCALVAICVAQSGCMQRVPTGGDTPITTERLTDTRLVSIQGTLSWAFTETTVVIENGGQPIPSDLAESVLGSDLTPTRIEASWQFDISTGRLLLSNVNVDEDRIDREVAIPIRPAGHVRVNVGDRQYNMFRSDKSP